LSRHSRIKGFLLIGAAVVPLFVGGPRYLGAQEDPVHGEAYPLYRLMRAELLPFEIAADASIETIRDYYAPCSAGTDALLVSGTFRSLGMDMAAHVWSVPGRTPSGSVIVLHGYLAHPRQMAPIITALILAGYDVAAPELPGHGISDGMRGYIGDFSDYGTFLDDFMSGIGASLPGPLHIIGFSTGASAVIEYLHANPDPFAAIVFASPLVRSRFFSFARVGRFVARPFTDTLRTGYDDPIGTQRMPLAWFDAQVAWNRRNTAYPVNDRPLLVVQGTRDTVVARRYNRRYLDRLFTDMEYVPIPGSRHVIYRDNSTATPSPVEETVRYIREYQ